MGAVNIHDGSCIRSGEVRVIECYQGTMGMATFESLAIVVGSTLYRVLQSRSIPHRAREVRR